MPNLTMNEIQRVYDSVKRVLYIHPDDREHQLVKSCQENGYEIATLEILVKGKAFILTPAHCGVVDFEKGEAVLGKNTLLDWLTPARCLTPVDL